MTQGTQAGMNRARSGRDGGRGDGAAVMGRGRTLGGRRGRRGRAARRAAPAASCCALLLTAWMAAPPALASATGPAIRRPGRRPVIGGPQLAGHGVIVNYPARHAPRLPYVAASSYLIADAGTGDVLAAKDPHGRYPPASTLKVLTAIALMPVLSPGQIVTASKRAADVEPSKAGLVRGQHYTVAALFRALLLISANDAAIALAQATGSYRKGVAMMNAEAHQLRADDTVAKRPNGLDARGQHSSAYDLALFARQALTIPALMRDEHLLSTRFEQWPHHWEKLYNQNTMLTSYPGDIFGKIGWTTPDKTTFIGIARRHGVTLIVTIMHCTPLTEMYYAARLLNWGFAMDGQARPIGTLVGPLPAHTAGNPAARHPARARPTRRPGAVARAGTGTPALPLAAGAGVIALAAIAGVPALLLTRRRSAGAGSRHGR